MSGHQIFPMGNAESKTNALPGVFENEQSEAPKSESSNDPPVARPDGIVQEAPPTSFNLEAHAGGQRKALLGPEAIAPNTVNQKDASIAELEKDSMSPKESYVAKRKEKLKAASYDSTAARKKAARGRDSASISFRSPVPASPTSALRPRPPQDPPSLSGAQPGDPTLFKPILDAKTPGSFGGTTNNNEFKYPGWDKSTNLTKDISGWADLKPTRETSTPLLPIVSQGGDSASDPSASFELPVEQLPVTNLFDFSSQPPTTYLFGQKQVPTQINLTSSGTTHLNLNKISKNQDHEPSHATSPAKLSLTSLIPDDLLSWVREFLDLEAPNMGPLQTDLKTLHGSIILFMEEILQSADVNARTGASILAMQDNISQFESVPSATNNTVSKREALAHDTQDYRQRITNLEAQTKSNESTLDKVTNTFAKNVLIPLQTYSRLNNLSWEARIDGKNNYISELRTKMLGLEQDLVKQKKDLTGVKDWSEKLSSELMTKEAILSTQHIEHRKKMDSKIAEKDIERDEALRTQALKYRAKIANAEEAELRCKKATTQTEDLYLKIECLEKEKIALNLAKAAAEKEYRDLVTQADQWKSYKDAHDQIKTEFEELQIAYNDAITERDELLERCQALEVVEKDKSNSQPEVAAPQVQLAGGRTTNEDHLDGLKQHWGNRLKLAVDAMKKRRTEIAWHDSEIAKLRRYLESPVPPNAQSAEKSDLRSTSSFGTTKFQPLDVGPVVGEDHDLSIETGTRDDVPGRPTATFSDLSGTTSMPSQAWAAAARLLAPSPRQAPPSATGVAGIRARQRYTERATGADGTRDQEHEWQEVTYGKRGKDKTMRKDKP
ncbi:Nn.00g102530.m01.CDS01 [Neocucurbitaria sp. VM-36]